MTKAPDLQKTTDFIYRNARLIDRLRFAYFFQNGSKEPVLAALAAYQNSDGGFGNALEPDLRAPISQPIPVWTAFGILDELDEFNSPMVARALEYLSGITTKEGGVPFVLPSVSDYPHAPWWEASGEQSADLNPTAAIVAFLYRHRVEHPWLARAADFCWQRIEKLTETSPYELGVILSFLDAAPDRKRAEKAFKSIKTLVEKQAFIELDPYAKGEVHFPLEFAPTPDTIGRQLFSKEIISQHLDALVQKQQPDGGWRVNWPIWTPVTEYEWRGEHTVKVLKTLRAYDRL